MNREAFEQFVRDTHEKALRLAFGWLGDWEEARDAVQESFIRAHGKMEQFAGAASFSTWYYRILTNHLKDRLRRRKMKRMLSVFSLAEEGAADRLPALAEDPEESLLSSALRREVAKAVKALPTRQAEVFRMKSLLQMTYAEIGQVLGISDGAAKTHHGRAVESLKRTLSRWRDEP